MQDIPFGALFEQSAVGLATFSVGGRFLSTNPAFCRLLGYTEHELLEKTHLDVVHPEDLESAALSRVQAISGKTKPRIIERRYLHKDGSTVWMQLAGTVVRDAAGAPQYTVLLAIDVSGLRRALRSSEQRFRRMIEMGSDWYWVQDTGFRFVEVTGLESHDLDSDVVIGKARWELPNLGALPDRVWEQHRAKLERREPFSDFIFLRYNRAGELRYLSVSGEPLFDEHGEFKGYHGIGKDITERARDQKALEESEERYRRLFEVHPQPMWVVDAKNLSFLAVNVAAVRLYGYSKEEFVAMTADQIRPEEDVADLLKAFEDRSGIYLQRVWRHKKKNGELVNVKVVSFSLEFGGRPARLGVIHDLTEQLDAEQRARDIEQRYRELLEERQRAGRG
ncbi:MAG TPA: PAS domain S-box protein [Burkholderiales bacterium]|jgi:PAS domain S-box-containing protein